MLAARIGATWVPVSIRRLGVVPVACVVAPVADEKPPELPSMQKSAQVNCRRTALMPSTVVGIGEGLARNFLELDALVESIRFVALAGADDCALRTIPLGHQPLRQRRVDRHQLLPDKLGALQ